MTALNIQCHLTYWVASIEVTPKWMASTNEITEKLCDESLSLCHYYYEPLAGLETAKVPNEAKFKSQKCSTRYTQDRKKFKH